MKRLLQSTDLKRDCVSRFRILHVPDHTE
jgi:hypothetical protein